MNVEWLIASNASSYHAGGRAPTNPWVQFVQRVDPTFSDEFCQLLLRSLPILEREARFPLLIRIQQLVTAAASHVTDSNRQMRSRALAVLTFALAHRVHCLVLDFLLNTLFKVVEHIEYWEVCVANPSKFEWESGPAYWWSEFPTWGQFLDLNSWLNSVRSRQRQHIVTRLDALNELEKRFVERAGVLYEQMYDLQHVQEVTANLEPCLASTCELYYFVTGARHEALQNFSSPPSRGGRGARPNDATPELLLGALLDTLEFMPRFELTVREYVRTWQGPGHFKRNWYLYVAGGAVATFASYKIVSDRRRIAESLRQGRQILSNFAHEHLVEPALKIFNHVFKLLKNRQIETTAQQLQASRATLSNMLLAYGNEKRDFSPEQIAEMSAKCDMAIVMKRYEVEMQNPGRGLLAGDISRSLLIQIQKLKVDVETTMLSVDQLIEANEINFELGAIIPALLVFVPLFNAVYQYLRAKKIPLFEQRSFYQLRMLLRRIDKVLNMYSSASAPLRPNGAIAHVGAGFIFFHAAQIDSVSRGIISAAELRHLREDLQDLVTPTHTVVQQRTVIDRMTRTLPIMATASKAISL